MKDQLVYLCYGSGPIVAETEFSIVSAFRLEPAPAHEVVVYTDSPQRFAHLPVRTVELDGELLSRWSGPDGYAHRRKLEAVAAALRSTSGRVVFVDGDTWFRRPAGELFDRVDARRALMHVAENHLVSSGLDYNRELADHLRAGRFTDRAGTPYDFSADPVSWNSGVIGLTGDHVELVAEALHLLDQLQPAGLRVHTLEQFVLGAVLERSLEVGEALDVVYHYWRPDIRHPARDGLLRAVEETRGQALARRAEVLHRARPRPRGLIRLRAGASRVMDRTGLRHPVVRASS